MSAPLQDCPFCGSANVAAGYQGQPAQSFHMRCVDCGACGPSFLSSAPTGGVFNPAAIAAWGNRADSDEREADYHTVMNLGRLLAEIAIELKGQEPAGTRWSYHDLPEIVGILKLENDLRRDVMGQPSAVDDGPLPEWSSLKCAAIMKDIGDYGPTVHAAQKELKGYQDGKCYIEADELRKWGAGCFEAAYWLEKRAAMAPKETP